MYYSELVKKACVIMYDAHKEDKDKGGYPYVFHPFYLATQMDDEDSTCAALLHDVVEDTVMTSEDVEKEFTTMSEMYNMEVEKIKSLISPESIKADLANQKALDFIKTSVK